MHQARQPPSTHIHQATRNHSLVGSASGLILHLAMHSAVPEFEPVPIGVIFDCTSLLARFWPKAALTRSIGKPLVKTLPMF